MNEMKLLKIAKGQLESSIKMIEDGRYCIDISKQLLATQALIKKANLQILDNHIRHCVKDAILEGNSEEKIAEVMEIVSKYTK
jgi:DNA-binding FrmR family transcriptional regulator